MEDAKLGEVSPSGEVPTANVDQAVTDAAANGQEALGKPVSQTHDGEMKQEVVRMNDDLHSSDVGQGTNDIQAMVNDVLASKLEGFQAQMQQMFSMIQNVSGVPVNKTVKVEGDVQHANEGASGTAVKNDSNETSVTMEVGASVDTVQDASGAGGNSASKETSVSKEAEASVDMAQKKDSVDTAQKKDSVDTAETAMVKRQRRNNLFREQLQEQAAQVERERKEFLQFIVSIAPFLNLPVPPEVTSEGPLEGTLEETTKGTQGGTVEENLKETLEGTSETLKETPAGTTQDSTEVIPEVTSETPERNTEESSRETPEHASDAPQLEGSPVETAHNTKEKRPTVIENFPADQMVQKSWESVKGKNISSSFFIMKEKVGYPWPLEDKANYLRGPVPNNEMLQHLGELNKESERKGFAGLPMGLSRVNRELQLIYSIFGYQQRIQSYASYFLTALSQHIAGESNLDKDMVSGLLKYLGKSLVDACDTSVHGCITTTRARRRLYLEAMQLAHVKKAQFIVTTPVSKELFPPDLKEALTKRNIHFLTPSKEKKLASKDNANASGEQPTGQNNASGAKARRPRKRKSVGAGTASTVSASGGHPTGQNNASGTKARRTRKRKSVSAGTASTQESGPQGKPPPQKAARQGGTPHGGSNLSASPQRRRPQQQGKQQSGFQPSTSPQRQQQRYPRSGQMQRGFQQGERGNHLQSRRQSGAVGGRSFQQNRGSNWSGGNSPRGIQSQFGRFGGGPVGHAPPGAGTSKTARRRRKRRQDQQPVSGGGRFSSNYQPLSEGGRKFSSDYQPLPGGGSKFSYDYQSQSQSGRRFSSDQDFTADDFSPRDVDRNSSRDGRSLYSNSFDPYVPKFSTPSTSKYGNSSATNFGSSYQNYNKSDYDTVPGPSSSYSSIPNVSGGFYQSESQPSQTYLGGGYSSFSDGGMYNSGGY